MLATQRMSAADIAPPVGVVNILLLVFVLLFFKMKGASTLPAGHFAIKCEGGGRDNRGKREFAILVVNKKTLAVIGVTSQFLDCGRRQSARRWRRLLRQRTHPAYPLGHSRCR